MQHLQKFIFRSSLIGLFISLTGCSLLQPHHSETALPENPAKWNASAEINKPVSTGWLENFADQNLSYLIKEAIGNNFDLKLAAARVEAAHANAKISGADRWPQISASLNASRAKRNSVVGGNIISGISNNFQTGVEVSWEADIWGKLSHQTRAAVLELAASESDFQAAKLSLAANIARQWFNNVEARQQVKLAAETVKNYQSALTIIRENYQAGLNSALDVRLAKTNVATAQNQLALRQLQLDNQLRSLQILLGRYPTANLETAEQLPDLKNKIPAGTTLRIITTQT